ncbi:MAG TPA: DUF4126 domain-containing protein [Bryobacteraceae bacterium]
MAVTVLQPEGTILSLSACGLNSAILSIRGSLVNPLQTIALTLGAGFSSGLNLYATVATLGLLERFGIIHLSRPLEILSHPLVIGIAIGLYVVEFFADKIPYVDSIWDVVHTFIRPPAAALLAYAAVVGAPAEWRWAAALVAGGVALTSHGAKATTRAAINTSPEPLSNWALSFGEDLLAVWLTWFATKHPVATVVIVVALVVLCAYLLFRLFRFARRVFARV